MINDGSKNVIYTANIGGDTHPDGYDTLAPIPEKYREGWECVCVTDDVYRTPPGWQAVWIDPADFGGLPPVAIAKWCKIEPSKWLWGRIPEPPKWLLWIDANISIGRPLDDIVSEFPQETVFATQHHSARLSFYDEIQAAARYPRPYLDGLAGKFEAMEADYRARGMPDEKEFLNHNNIILRRPTERVRAFESAWWSEFAHYEVWRDQIALRAAAWRTGFRFDLIPELNRKGVRWARHTCLPPAGSKRKRR